MPEYTLKNITVVFRSHVVGAAQLDLELSFHRNNGQKNKASHRKFPWIPNQETRIQYSYSRTMLGKNLIVPSITNWFFPAGKPSTSPRFPRGFMGEFKGIIPVEISSWFPCGNSGEMKGNFLCGYFRLLSLWNPWGYFHVEISLVFPWKISKCNIRT